MFFLMKCFFWLALVYAAILYGIGPLGSFSDGRFAGQSPEHAAIGHKPRADAVAIHGVIDTAMGSAVGLCASHAAECLAEASRLTALFRASTADTSAAPLEVFSRVAKAHDAEMAERDPARFDDAPMPVPDPRRQGRALKLTPKF